MEFKKLDIEPEESWVRRKFLSQHAKKTFLYIVLGAVAGLVYYYFTEGQNLKTIHLGDIFKSMLIGGFLGFFITNSPCAQNKC